MELAIGQPLDRNLRVSTVDSKHRKKAILVLDMEGAKYVLAKSRSKQKSHKNLNGAQEVYGMMIRLKNHGF